MVFREVCINKPQKLCPYVSFYIAGEWGVEPGNGSSSTLFLDGGLGGGDGGLKLKLVLVTTFLQGLLVHRGSCIENFFIG